MAHIYLTLVIRNYYNTHLLDMLLKVCKASDTGPSKHCYNTHMLDMLLKVCKASGTEGANVNDASG